MNTIEILVGMIGSGKSTYARARAREGALVISHDWITQGLHREYRYEQGLRDCYRAIEEKMAWAILNAGRDVVVDRTHLTRESRERWIKSRNVYVSLNTLDGHAPDIRIVAVQFPAYWAGLHVMIRMADDPRGRSPEEWLKVAEMHEQQRLAEPLAEDEGFDDIIMAPPMERK